MILRIWEEPVGIRAGKKRVVRLMREIDISKNKEVRFGNKKHIHRRIYIHRKKL